MSLFRLLLVILNISIILHGHTMKLVIYIVLLLCLYIITICCMHLDWAGWHYSANLSLSRALSSVVTQSVVQGVVVVLEGVLWYCVRTC